MRGIPFDAGMMDVAEFFKPLEPVHIEIEMNEKGRPKGEADAYFATVAEAKEAMQKNKDHMGNRYVELFHDGKKMIPGSGGMSSMGSGYGNHFGGGKMGGRGGFGGGDGYRGNMGGGFGNNMGGGFGGNMGGGYGNMD